MSQLRLQDFLGEHRDAILARCRAMLNARMAPRPTSDEIAHGIPLFFDQLVDTLRLDLRANPKIGPSAAQHGGELQRRGFTVSQVVHDYGDLCQSITGLATELDAPIAPGDFRTLNRCLDDAIAEAVTEYGRRHDDVLSDDGTQRINERLGVFAHELRNQLTKAMLAFDALKSGTVGPGGSTATALGRSLTGLRFLIDRSLADVRLTAGIHDRSQLRVAELIEELEIHAALEANSRAMELVVQSTDASVVVDADRQILAAVLTNLLHNAFKFTHPKGRVSVQVRTTEERVMIDVADECGGLPPGKVEELFRPFEQRGTNRSGAGLGLAISRRGAEANGGKLEARNLPGIGCVFTLDLPRVGAQ